CRVLRRWLLDPSSILGASTKNSRQLAVSSRQSTAEQSADLRGFHGLRNQATKGELELLVRFRLVDVVPSAKRTAVLFSGSGLCILCLFVAFLFSCLSV